MNETRMLNPTPLKDKHPRAICVFCGSSHGKNPRYAEAARKMGALLAEHGFSVVFGGGGLGLMGETARAARDAGARVQGILPDFLKHLEPPLDTGERVTLTPDLFTRKERMIGLADGFAVLPGGNGTMDEFFEILTSAQLGLHRKPIVVVNVAGYFDPLLKLLDHIVAEEFAKPDIRNLFHVCATPEEAVRLFGDLLQRAAAD
jgi:uncharacterized protein (TIGR00730 family)